jgi:hypothetical protein
MSELVKVGAIVVNFDYVKNIFDDPENPDTLVMILSEPTLAGGPQPNFPHLSFTGEEAAAVRWYIANFIQDITLQHKDVLDSESKPRRKVVGVGIDLMKEARADRE